MTEPKGEGHWVTTWAASAQGPYPVGSAIAQPDLSAAIPSAAEGLVNQSLRMVLRPAQWAPWCRLRLSHVFGDRTLRLRGLRLGLHWSGGALVPGTGVVIPDQDIPPGQSQWTAALALPWLNDQAGAAMMGRSLGFSAWVEGASGPITWHAKSMVTSYLSAPGDCDAAQADSELGFPHTTTSTFVIDALDVWLPKNASALVALGDSLTDGTATTLNGQDRWTDALQRALWANGAHEVAVVNAGIGGNQVAGPAAAAGYWRGGPAAIERLQRDVLSLSDVRQVVWLQGINDFSDNGNTDAEELIGAVRAAVQRMHAQGLNVIGATLPSALGSTREGQGSALQDQRRRTFNECVRSGALFDRWADIDAALTDPTTGRLHSAFNGDSTLGEVGDGIHPNRAGHLAMAGCILKALT